MMTRRSLFQALAGLCTGAAPAAAIGVDFSTQGMTVVHDFGLSADELRSTSYRTQKWLRESPYAQLARTLDAVKLIERIEDDVEAQSHR